MHFMVETANGVIRPGKNPDSCFIWLLLPRLIRRLHLINATSSSFTHPVIIMIGNVYHSLNTINHTVQRCYLSHRRIYNFRFTLQLCPILAASMKRAPYQLVLSVR